MDTAAEANAFTNSVKFDTRLAHHDIAGSIAHARMLHHVGLLKKREMEAIVDGLETIGGEIAEGQFEWRSELEDVHMNIETALTERVPGPARCTLAGRETIRWRWIRVCGCARKSANWPMNRPAARDDRAGRGEPQGVDPGYTHLQRAQPVYLAHHLLAYVEMFERDYEQLLDCLVRVNVCPLGSGAIAGSTLPLDREFVARELGFVDAHEEPMVTQNSMDAVAGRKVLWWNFAASQR